MGERRAAAALTPSPFGDLKGDAWVGLLAARAKRSKKHLHAERPTGEAWPWNTIANYFNFLKYSPILF